MKVCEPTREETDNKVKANFEEFWEKIENLVPYTKELAFQIFKMGFASGISYVGDWIVE